ncbi:sigma-54-dependent transcriptional regulator [Thiohalophilus thiocyanatoxydans]|uniref:Two-component system response regulator HydG n=1 Tax=Thiohalophilus thiocyanatoxydans TaxID=381308 RepID=A0A4R8IPP7_9GAMM|nr:sigma-54 dependent transcriptional regulator [Thiohalophilus thiocyanatoxydans]TDY02498.1 two-component system response regulator HydG [Thiohalophilus thiocyanatoxydans]
MSAETPRILFVDDDIVTCRVMQRNCDNAGYACDAFQNGADCLALFNKQGADVVITDLRMPGMNGFELLSEIRKIDSEVPVLVMTGYSSVENAVEAMKRGASDFIKKPFDFTELKLLVERALKSVRLRNENRLLKKRLGEERHRFGMIGDTPAMQTLFNTVEKVAEVSCSALITGDSGTGKELVARALHDFSPRKDAPFVAVDCGALTTTLLESELFGHEKGAFTGATQRKYGLMEQADGGTLFLDEICNISDTMQIKLMRALESSKVTRVGANTAVPVDVRVIAASNRNLEQMVEEGHLRHDFYHRLNVVNIHVPSLSERRQDIPALVDAFVQEFADRYSRQVQGFDKASLQKMCDADWPGNVRELRNTIERSVILAEGPVLHWEGTNVPKTGSQLPVHFSEEAFCTLTELEEEYIHHVLRCFNGKKTRAAEVLGIDKTTLWRKLRRLETEEEAV